MPLLRRVVESAAQHLHLRCLTASRALGTPLNHSTPHPESLGFKSPGNTGISNEMKEAGSPQDDQKNVEATHMHNYSEKMRFDNQMYSNAELVGKGTAAADAGDTGPERAVPIPDEDKNGGPDSKLKVGSDEEKMKKRVAQKKESKSDNPNDSKTDRHVMDYSR